MNRYDVMNYIQERYNLQPEYLWNKYPDYAVFRHPSNNKWFAIIMNVDSKSIHINQDEPVPMVDTTEYDLLVIKANPEDVEFYKTQPGYGPAYHMNKKHWLSILLSGPIDKKEIMDFVDGSFLLTE